MFFSYNDNYIPIDTIVPNISLIDNQGKVNHCRLSLSKEKNKKTGEDSSLNISLKSIKARDFENRTIGTPTLKVSNIDLLNDYRAKGIKSLKSLNIPLPRKNVAINKNNNTKKEDMKPDIVLKTLLTPKRVFRRINKGTDIDVLNKIIEESKPKTKTLIRNNSFANMKDKKDGNKATTKVNEYFFNPIEDYYKVKQNNNSNCLINKKLSVPKMLTKHPQFKDLFKGK
jgi:hypothetical protein